MPSHHGDRLLLKCTPQPLPSWHEVPHRGVTGTVRRVPQARSRQRGVARRGRVTRTRMHACLQKADTSLDSSHPQQPLTSPRCASARPATDQYRRRTAATERSRSRARTASAPAAAQTAAPAAAKSLRRCGIRRRSRSRNNCCTLAVRARAYRSPFEPASVQHARRSIARHAGDGAGGMRTLAAQSRAARSRKRRRIGRLCSADGRRAHRAPSAGARQRCVGGQTPRRAAADPGRCWGPQRGRHCVVLPRAPCAALALTPAAASPATLPGPQACSSGARQRWRARCKRRAAALHPLSRRRVRCARADACSGISRDAGGRPSVQQRRAVTLAPAVQAARGGAASSVAPTRALRSR
jgi:hypothetical protein